MPAEGQVKRPVGEVGPKLSLNERKLRNSPTGSIAAASCAGRRNLLPRAGSLTAESYLVFLQKFPALKPTGSRGGRCLSSAASRVNPPRCVPQT